MGARRVVVLVAVSGLATWMIAPRAIAAVGDPPGSGSGSGSGSGNGGDIEIEPDAPGSGSGSGSGAATKPPEPVAPTEPTEPTQPVKDPKLAKKWLTAAQQLVTRGDQLAKAGKAAEAKAQYDNAVTAYAKAIEAGDDVGVYLALAQTEDKAGTPAAAYKHYKLLVDPKSGAKPDVVKKAQAKLDELTAKIGTVTLTVKPEGATISLAGAQIGESPMAEPVVLAPGTYMFSFAAVGYQPKDAEIKVEAGSESERTIELEPVPVTIKLHPHEFEPDKPEPKPLPDRLPLYIGAGATGGLLVLGTITGIAAITAHHTFTNPGTSPAVRADAQSYGRTRAHVADAFFVGTLLAAAFTSYWYLYQYTPAQRAYDAEHPTAKVEVVPWVQPQGGGLAIAGEL